EIYSGKRGFGQADAGQFERNTMQQLEVDESGEWSFAQANANLKCTVYGSPENSFELLDTRYQINLDVQDYSGCGLSPAIHVAVLDSATFAPWETNYNGLHPENDFGNLMDCSNSRNRTEKYFIFQQNSPSQMEGLVNLLQGGIEDGHHLLVYSWQYVDYDSWQLNAPELFDVFSDMGSQQIGVGQDSVPFIFYTKMGEIESVQEMYGSSSDALLNLEVELEGLLGNGLTTSPLLGQGSSWEEFEWESESEPGDEVVFQIKGWNDGTLIDVIEYSESAGVDSELPSDLTVSEYPFVAIAMGTSDQESLTPNQLSEWRILGEHLPECALDAQAGWYFPKDTLQKGDEVVIGFTVKNIGEYPMDSILMSYTLQRGSERLQVDYKKLPPLQPGESVLDTAFLSTLEVSGEMTLLVEANAMDPQFNEFDQREQHRFNNRWQHPIVVLEDRINPILDVTFDGQHILDGDLVSASPTIRAQLKDNNEFLLMNEIQDTSSFKLFLTGPDQVQIPLFFAQDNVVWVPAGNNNQSAVEFYPEFVNDGQYQLLVQAQDKSGNSSGDMDYRIHFEVITESSITDVLNYPNPFTTSTQFVFTVTGDSHPDEIYIQIMSISGRVVREIRTEEFGPIRVGRNWSEFRWDGRDDFGDDLGRGVYLYRVIAKKNGVELKVRESAASPYFTKGIGKMYKL
ncbi:MAG: hypothetical protein HRT74_11650, partial [Flavobacteriales bacterium]|nr:hypothetical protein [Flavobacteriales bacterium]